MHDKEDFVIEFTRKLNIGDILYYIVLYNTDNQKPTNSDWRSHGTIFYWTVTELLDSYTNTSSYYTPPCEERLFHDDYLENELNMENWIVEHKIPTYTGPRFVFNSYLNTPETVFIKGNVLHLQPIALTNEDDVRGTLNLGSSCTSSILDECIYTQHSTFLLPPVKSAMLRSKRTFRYGRFQINAKLPVGDWILPIIQLARPRPIIDHVSVDELWIAFSRGKVLSETNDLIGDFTTQFMFAGPVNSADEPTRIKKLISYNLTQGWLENSFHIFELRWYPEKLQFFVDQKLIGELNSELGSFGTSGSNVEYELQIGVGIGGLIDFPDGVSNKPWNNNERNYMKKFYQDRFNWLKTWNGTDTALQVYYVSVTAL